MPLCSHSVGEGVSVNTMGNSVDPGEVRTRPVQPDSVAGVGSGFSQLVLTLSS